jgi:hypothetical protein
VQANCQKFLSNRMLLMLAALAYKLMQHLKSMALKGTELERARAQTIRVRPLKIAAAIVSNTRRIQMILASNHPLRDGVGHAVEALSP